MKRLTYIVLGTLFLLYFICYQGVLSHIVVYHEQHHLFLFSNLYFSQCVQSEGWLGYLTNFVIQFFYIHCLGSIILAFLLTAVYWFVNRVIKILLGQEDVFQLSLIPSAVLFFYTMSVDHPLSVLVGCFLLLFMLYVVLSLVRHYSSVFPLVNVSRISNRYARVALPVICLSTYAGYGFYHFIHSYNRSERMMLKTEQLVKAGEWEKVLDYTGRYLMTGRTNQLISYFRHLALYHTGKLSANLFDFPQTLGVKGLYFPWDGNSRGSEYGHILYEDLGYINEAQRWEFEAMVVWGETAPHLINLARYNIVIHRPLVAQRFINKLKRSLFYREEASRLEAWLREGKVPGLRNALEGRVDTPARFANVVNIGPELQYVLECDSTNRMAFEYLMSDLLLSNHVVRFVNNLKWMPLFSYTDMPRIYEEALYIYKLGVDEEEFSKIGIRISPGMESRFKRYYQLVQSKQMETLRKEFGNTYWFYLNYISPYGNRVIAN